MSWFARIVLPESLNSILMKGSLNIPFKVHLQESVSTLRVSPSVRTRQSGLFVNLGRIEMTYRAQTIGIISLAVRYL